MVEIVHAIARRSDPSKRGSWLPVQACPFYVLVLASRNTTCVHRTPTVALTPAESVTSAACAQFAKKASATGRTRRRIGDMVVVSALMVDESRCACKRAQAFDDFSRRRAPW